MTLSRTFFVFCLAGYLLMAGLAQAQGPGLPSYEKGVQLGTQGKFTEARVAFEQALKAKPPFIPARNCLGVLDDI